VAQCPPLAVPSQGSISRDDFSFGSEVHFSCEPGYELTDEQPLICTAQLQWSASVPACIGMRATLLFSTL